jgi:hypothetical protein
VSTHQSTRPPLNDTIVLIRRSRVDPECNASNARYFFTNSNWSALQWNRDDSGKMDRKYQRLGWAV